MILSGWKEIAGYLRCGVRTVQRWEADGLPIHRPSPAKRSHVIAHSEELDRWVRNGCSELGYPHVSASITGAQRLQDEARAKLVQLQMCVSRLRTTVAELQARRPRDPVSQAIEVAGIYEPEHTSPRGLA